MSRWQQAFFLLLQAGLWEKISADLSLFPLSAEEWQKVYDESRRQTVQGLLYRGFQLLPEHFFPPQSVLFLWLTDISVIEDNNRQMQRAIASSQRLLSQAGMEGVLQKGVTAARLYEHPELRSCGDVDWYVVPREGSWESLPSFLQERGYEPLMAADGSIFFTCEGVEIELHRRLIDIQNPRKRSLLTRLSDEGSLTMLALTDSLSVKTPQPLPTMTMFMAHMMKHALTVGIGLRQFCDMARAYHVWHGHYDTALLTDSYRRLGMQKWSMSVHGLLVNFLGLPPVELPAPLPDHHYGRQLMERVMLWGNFGQHTRQWPGHPSKQYTVRQIISNLPLSLRYAPVEAFYKIKGLVKGHGKIKKLKNKKIKE